MNISKNMFVSLSYELHSESHEGPIVEKCDASNPLSFVFGAGRMLPAFEKGIENLQPGDAFQIALTPDEAYGPRFPEAVTDVPKNIFVTPDGRLREDLLKLGARVPMINDEGQHIIGTVLSIEDDEVKLDFNHPLAGEALFFSGSVIEVREATVDELLGQSHGCGGGCHGGCGGGCHGGDDDGGCDGGCHGGCGDGSCGCDDGDDDECGCGGSCGCH